jgi:hypothetical protein
MCRQLTLSVGAHQPMDTVPTNLTLAILELSQAPVPAHIAEAAAAEEAAWHARLEPPLLPPTEPPEAGVFQSR